MNQKWLRPGSAAFTCAATNGRAMVSPCIRLPTIKTLPRLSASPVAVMMKPWDARSADAVGAEELRVIRLRGSANNELGLSVNLGLSAFAVFAVKVLSQRVETLTEILGEFVSPIRDITKRFGV